MVVLFKLLLGVSLTFLIIKIFFDEDFKVKVLEKLIKNSKDKLKSSLNINYIEEKGYFILSPNDEVEEEKKLYVELLDRGVKTENIRNIGLTGTYGSGKSTILKAFKKETSKKFLEISLLDFLETKDINIQELEKNILQQIFYSIKKTKVPLSRFQKIYKPSKRKILGFTLIIGINIILLFLLEWKTFSDLIKINNEVKKIILVGFTSLFMLNLYFLINKAKEIKIQHSNCEISLLKEEGKNSEKKILNEFLDEIIYYISESEIDGIIIEDLDRMNDFKLLTNLREINMIINNSQEIQKKITFIYAIKDEIFKSKDRTKFFDLIIPVIPVLTSTNCEGILSKKFEGLGYTFKNGFLENILLYIHDMRLGLNIINEFKIYYEILKNNSEKTTIKEENLLAIIIYKNLYPEEYNKLYTNSGELYEIFNKRKENFIEKKIEDKKNRLKELENLQKEIKKESLESINELKLLYALYLTRRYINQYVYIEGERILIQIINTSEELIKIFNQFEEKKGLAFNPQLLITNIDINNLELEMGVKLKYEERKKRLENKKEIEKIKIEEKQLKNSIEKYKNRSLKNLIVDLEQSEKEELILSKENTENKYFDYNVKAFLIFNGYINEFYSDYISFVKSGQLKAEDINFIQKMNIQEPGLENYSIKDPEKILKRMRVDEKYALNYILINYSKNNNENEMDYFEFIKIMANEFIENYKIVCEFIVEYLKNDERFFSKFIEYNPKIWDLILQEKENLENYINIEKFWELFINNLSIEEIKKMNEKCEGKFIESLKEFSSILEHDIKIEKLKYVNNEFKTKIKEIKYVEVANENFIKFIIEEEMYEINLKNIRVIYKLLLKEDLKEDKILEILKNNSNLEKVWEYVLKNKKEFLDEVYFKINQHTQNDEEGLIEIINGIASESELVEKLVENMSPIIINNLEKLEKNLKEKFFENLKVKNNLKNLKIYMEEKEFKKYLVGMTLEYLQSYILDFEIENINEEENIFDELMETDIEIELFKKILSRFKVKKVTMLKNKTEENYKEKVKYLINERILEFTSETFGVVYELLLETEEFNKFMNDKTNKNINEEDTEIKFEIISNYLDDKYHKIVELIIKKQEKIPYLNQIFKKIIEEERITEIDSLIDFSISYKEIKDIFEKKLDVYGNNFKEIYIEDIKRLVVLSEDKKLIDYDIEFTLDLLEARDAYSEELENRFNDTFKSINWKENLLNNDLKEARFFIELLNKNYITSENKERFIEILLEEEIDLEKFKKIIKFFKKKIIDTVENKNEENYKKKIKELINEEILNFTDKNFETIYELLLETKEFNKFMNDKIDENITEKEDIDRKTEIISKLFKENYHKIIELLISKQEKIPCLNNIFKKVIEEDKVTNMTPYKTLNNTYRKLKYIFEKNLKIYGENFKEIYITDVKRWQIPADENFLTYDIEFILDLLDAKDDYSKELENRFNDTFESISWKENLLNNDLKEARFFIELLNKNYITDENKKRFIEVLLEEEIDLEKFKKIIKFFKKKIVDTVENKNEENYKKKIKELINEEILNFTDENFETIYELLLETKEFNKFMNDKIDINMSEEVEIDEKVEILSNVLKEKYHKIIELVIDKEKEIPCLNNIFKKIVEEQKATRINSIETFSNTYRKLKNIFEKNSKIYGENFKEIYITDVKRWDILEEDSLLTYNSEFLLNMLEDKDDDDIYLKLQEKLNNEFNEIEWESEIQENSKVFKLFLLLLKNNFIEEEIEQKFLMDLMNKNINFETFKIIIENNKFLRERIKKEDFNPRIHRNKLKFIENLKKN